MKDYEESDVMKMTDSQLAETYRTIFPQKSDVPKEYESYPFEFRKVSLLKDVPIHYSTQSYAQPAHA